MTDVKRCAIYTRKSSEEGLDQAFNSLDAQREACEAYVKSQKSEGWRGLPAGYDDGGYSGGTMDRPGLTALLAEIAAGRIDVVVVYKIDRLTRSLADFARMVELFDRHAVSFVSVTQAFNTTTSMGRLTLNVLLSFAQFEREVTGERIRDKLAASRAKGMWMGGTVPLGYDRPADAERALVVNEAEAETVRAIFTAYLEVGSVHVLQRQLEARGIRPKRRISRTGAAMGGTSFARGALFHLLRNRLYRGEIVDKGVAHPGRHQAIVDAGLFDAVQARLDAGVQRQVRVRDQTAKAPLAGRIVDGDGAPMSPTFTRGRRGQPYRYYVSAPLQQGRRLADSSAIRRVAGPALEGLVSATIRRIVPRAEEPLTLLERVEVHADTLQVLLPVAQLAGVRSRLANGETAAVDPATPTMMRLTLPVRMRLRGGRTWVLGAAAPAARADATLVRALRRAHAMLRTDATGMPLLAEAPASPYMRRILRLAFLAPDLQRDILAGRHPPGLTLEQLMHRTIPYLWSEQAALFDDSAASSAARAGNPSTR